MITTTAAPIPNPTAREFRIAVRHLCVALVFSLAFASLAGADTTPMSCKEFEQEGAAVPQKPALVQLCRQLEANHLQASAKVRGAPKPSRAVVDLPSYGSEQSVASGLACMGGRAMRRLPNGWEQLLDESGNWQRCEAQE